MPETTIAAPEQLQVPLDAIEVRGRDYASSVLRPLLVCRDDDADRYQLVDGERP
jgi:hypothetical protein